jgi:integrase
MYPFAEQILAFKASDKERRIGTLVLEVNRELALLKHMFNLAINWDLHLGSNPLRKVKFFQEINTGFRVLSQEEETRLLRNATPAIQDIILYALNTGSRIGDVFSLRWQHVDLDKGLINMFSQKTRRSASSPSTGTCAGFWSFGCWEGRTNLSSTTRKPENHSLTSMRVCNSPAKRRTSQV